MVLVTINKSAHLAVSTGGFCEGGDVTLLNTVRDRKYVGSPSLGRLAVQGLAGVVVNKPSVEL